MTAFSGRKRKWNDDLDFIPTISDSDDIPDLDAEADEEAESAVAGTSVKSAKQSQKLGLGAISTNEDLKLKRKKKKRKKQDPSSFEEGEQQDIGWTSKGQDDGAFDPEFDFQDFNDGAVTDGFDGWELPNGQRVEESAVSRGGDVDEIIRRRRAREEEELPDGDGIEPEDLGGNEDEIDAGLHGFDPDDELLAEDAFGMSAAAESDESEEDVDDEDEEQSNSSNGLAVQPVNDAELKDEQSAGDDEEEIASPMPEPDNIAELAYSDEENQDPQANARRDAFFAPEEKSLDPKKLSQTEESFSSMSLSRPILRGLTAVGFTSPTPIQSKTVPVALMGKDVVGGAVTGSGKTAAFILPILERLLYRPKKVPTTRVSILMPTREIAVQCFSVATKLAQFTDVTFALIVGGLSLRDQEQTLKKRPDIVIATPGRFIDHMRNTASFAVEHLEILVLDEADRMLEDGFADELNEVLNTIPRSRQTMLFSATMTQDVDKLIRVGMNRPVRLMVNAKQQTVSGLVQEFIKLKGGPSEGGSDGENTHDNRRLATLLQLCRSVYTTQTIVFLPTKSLAHRVKVLFALNDVPAAELHGSMSQEQRLNAIATFRDGQATHLLATDLASRGLDIPRVDTVINYTVPTTRESYLHRVGRTARAGRTGVSCTLFSAEKQHSSMKGKQVSERTLLRPILRLAKSQKALIRTRTLPVDALIKLSKKIERLQEEVDAILKEEKEERLLAQTERDMTKGENMMDHEEEIMSRPRRTWFQSEKIKQAAKDSGKAVRMGVADETTSTGVKKKKKQKLSGKEKKKLDARDERKASGGWKKRKDERAGGGVLKKDKVKKKSKSKPTTASQGSDKRKRKAR